VSADAPRRTARCGSRIGRTRRRTLESADIRDRTFWIGLITVHFALG
jgi:hypothetical protein